MEHFKVSENMAITWGLKCLLSEVLGTVFLGRMKINGR